MPHIPFDNTYARELPGLYVAVRPATPPAPRLLYLNRPLAEALGLDPAGLEGAEGAALFSGLTLPEGAEPIAQAYAGHQFGGFSPQLGDGRALLLGELIDRQGQRRDIAFKGSGRTPFSRGGDGKAAVGPMLREVLIGEAMHALGVPTTRALAVAATGEQVRREAAFPGAVLTRVAASHLRVGTFQYFASRGEHDKLALLADYAIARHDPALVGTPGRHLALLEAVARRQARLIAQWMNLGFIHGVMNTDNMTISGETIDYGPCAFMEAYSPATVFSSIDHGGRYAYGQQPKIARWNLARLAEALLPLMVESEDEAAVQRAVNQVKSVIDAFPAWYEAALLQGQRAKLGLQQDNNDAGDGALVGDWLALLQQHGVDFTLAWRRLGDAAAGDANPLRALFTEPSAVNPWLARWQARCQHEDRGDAGAGAARAARMGSVNPWIIPRNHRVEEALAAASEADDLQPFEQLLNTLRAPWDETAASAPYAQPAPAQVTAAYQTFCGT
jgi:serine/tyrosine/threonine adenylyltransferase